MIKKSFLKVLRPNVLRAEREHDYRQWWSKDQIEDYQIKKLQNLINYTYCNVPFYKELWDKYGITREVRYTDDLKRFPIVEKKDLKGAVSNFLYSKEFINNGNEKKLIWQSTTGSSGTPFRFPVNVECENKKNGVRRSLYKWYGLTPGVPWVKLWRGDIQTNFKDKFKSKLTRQFTISIYDPKFPSESLLSNLRLSEILNAINQIQPIVLDGFVSALVILAQYIRDNDFRVTRSIKSIVTGAECLTETDRDLLETVFRAKVFNRYGGTETSIIAHECGFFGEDGCRSMHVIETRIICENIDSELVLTDLDNYALPFIRYKNGDMIETCEAADCRCGRVSLRLKTILGRTNDYFITKSGAKISSHLWQNIFKKYMFVDRYQIIQEDMNKITVNIESKGNMYEIHEFKKLQAEIHSVVPDVIFSWNQVSRITCGAGGKFRQHICKVVV